MCSSMPSIHVCGQLTVENDRLQKKIKSLKKKNAILSLTMEEHKENHKMEKLLKSCKTFKEVETQTDSALPGWVRPKPVPKKPPAEPNKQSQPALANSQLLVLYNNLMKEREKGIQLNISQAEQISMLKMKVQQLEEKLKDSQTECLRLHRNGTPISRPVRPRSTTPISKQEHRKLKSERDKLLNEQKKFKKELAALDPKFFEEIEDLKFALQQSAKLNKKYEQCLRQLCKKFGVPYPFHETGCL